MARTLEELKQRWAPTRPGTYDTQLGESAPDLGIVSATPVQGYTAPDGTPLIYEVTYKDGRKGYRTDSQIIGGEIHDVQGTSKDLGNGWSDSSNLDSLEGIQTRKYGRGGESPLKTIGMGALDAAKLAAIVYGGNSLANAFQGAVATSTAAPAATGGLSSMSIVPETLMSGVPGAVPFEASLAGLTAEIQAAAPMLSAADAAALTSSYVSGGGATASWLSTLKDLIPNPSTIQKVLGAVTQAVGQNQVDKSIGRDINAMYDRLEGMSTINKDQRASLGNLAMDRFNTNVAGNALPGLAAEYNNVRGPSDKAGENFQYLADKFGAVKGPSNLVGDNIQGLVQEYAGVAKPTTNAQNALPALAKEYDTRRYQDLIDSTNSQLSTLYNNPMQNPIMQAVAKLATENASRRSAAGRGIQSGSYQAEMQDALMAALGQQFGTLGNTMTGTSSNLIAGQTGERRLPIDALGQLVNMDQQSVGSYTAQKNAPIAALGALSQADQASVQRFLAESKMPLEALNSLVGMDQASLQRFATEKGIPMSALNTLIGLDNSKVQQGTAAVNAGNAPLNATQSINNAALNASFATDPTRANLASIYGTAGQNAATNSTISNVANGANAIDKSWTVGQKILG